MARKDRAPNPPRRVQAPKQRRTPTAPRDAQRTRTLLYATAGAGILALGVVVGFIALAGGGSKDVKTAMIDAGCTYETFPGLEPQHLTNFNAKPKWNSVPPTTGPHHVQPAIWGFYEEPLNQVQVVHNLEHGGIAIQWGAAVPAAEVEKIRAFYDESPNGIVAAPFAGMKDRIALGAWSAELGKKGNGILAKCPRFDKDAFDAFLDAYRFKGPERIPAEFLAPGS